MDSTFKYKAKRMTVHYMLKKLLKGYYSLTSGKAYAAKWKELYLATQIQSHMPDMRKVLRRK